MVLVPLGVQGVEEVLAVQLGYAQAVGPRLC